MSDFENNTNSFPDGETGSPFNMPPNQEADQQTQPYQAYDSQESGFNTSLTQDSQAYNGYENPFQNNETNSAQDQQSYQNQTYQNQQSYQNQPYQNQPPYQDQPQFDSYNESPITYNVAQKKKKPVWLFALLGVAGIAVICTLLVLFVPTIRNTYDLLTLSSEKYYEKIDSRHWEKSIDNLTNSLKESAALSKKDQAVDFKETLSYKELALKLLSEDMENGDFPLEDIAVEGSYSRKDDRLGSNFSVSFNGSNVVSLDFYSDNDGTFYIRIPEISNEYLAFTAEDIISLLTSEFETQMADSSTDTQDAASDTINVLETLENVMENLSKAEIDYDLLNSILKRYADIIVDNLGEVEKEKGVTLSDDYLNTKTTKITVAITEEDFYNIVVAVVDKMKYDTELYDFIAKIYPITQAQYDSAISLVSEKLSEADTESFDDSNKIDMIVWVDSKGMVVGRGFSSENTMLSMHKLKNRDNTSIQLKLDMQDGASSFLIAGLLENKDGGVNGTLSLSAGTSTTKMDIGELVINNYRYNGSRDYEMDMSFIIKESFLNSTLGDSNTYGYSGDIQSNMKISSKDGSIIEDVSAGWGAPDNFMEGHVESAISDASDIAIPDKAFSLLNEWEAYLETVDFEPVIRNIGKIFNISEDEIEEAINDVNDVLENGLNPSSPTYDTDTENGDGNSDDLYGLDNEGSDADDLYGLDDGDSDADNDSDYDWNPPDVVNEMPGDEIPTSIEQLPASAEVDEDGYYYYELSEDLVKSSGLSDDNPHFDIYYKDVKDKLLGITSDLIGEDAVIAYTDSSNTVSGRIDGDSSYRYFNFITSDKMSSEEQKYDNYINIDYGTATGQIENIYIRIEKGDYTDTLGRILSILDPAYDYYEKDLQAIKKELDDSGSAEYNSISIYMYTYDDSTDIFIQPLSSYGAMQ